MRTIKLVIQYDGTRYAGWQYQENARSVQKTIEKALSQILSGPVRLKGASRTDAGVHARGQTASFTTASSLKLTSLKKALNGLLPKDIVVSKVTRMGADFNAQFAARSKHYRYSLVEADCIDPFVRRYAVRVVPGIDIASMRKAARHLVGRHDFRSFRSSGDDQKSFLRHVSSITISRKGPSISIDIKANGFLYTMARTIVGTLIEVGRGKFSSEQVKEIVKKRDRRLAGPTAPAKGLCLMRVVY